MGSLRTCRNFKVAVILKYCLYKRDRCYHALANDMSAKASEILNLKVMDIKFSFTEQGAQYAEVRITQGKLEKKIKLLEKRITELENKK